MRGCAHRLTDKRTPHTHTHITHTQYTHAQKDILTLKRAAIAHNAFDAHNMSTAANLPHRVELALCPAGWTVPVASLTRRCSLATHSETIQSRGPGAAALPGTLDLLEQRQTRTGVRRTCSPAVKPGACTVHRPPRAGWSRPGACLLAAAFGVREPRLMFIKGAASSR